MYQKQISARVMTDTGIDIPPGQSAFVKALPGQTWLTNPHGSGGRCGVSGNGVCANHASGYVAFMGDEGCMWGAAEAKDRYTVYWFPSGDDNATLRIPGPGRLVLGPNDDNLSDNDGSITVTIDVKAKSSTPPPKRKPDGKKPKATKRARR